MFNIHKNHKNLVLVAFLGFAGLSVGVAIFPAYQAQNNTEPLPEMEPMTEAENRGLNIYIREGCVACHTQQVRNIEMDETWGGRPSIPSDYYYSKQRMDVWRQSPSLLGSERTGPDLTSVGERQPSEDWHLLHLYNPRTVVPQSIMPSYPWLFAEKANPGKDEKILSVSNEFKEDHREIVPTQEALDLVAYLLSLKQASLTGQAPEFIPSAQQETDEEDAPGQQRRGRVPNGKSLYSTHCSSCHQADGTGLKGAFPSLVGSEVVNDNDPEMMVRIILQGYDARPEYAQMPAFAGRLSNEEIAAIANHERNSWGNEAAEITPEDVKEIRALVMKQVP